MSFVGDAIGSVIGGITGASQQADAAQQAAQTQAGASDVAIAEQKRQFDKMVELMMPYVSGGQQALTQQGNLIGLGGVTAQQGAINQLQQSPQYQSLINQGENAILQNASATGGLRGGNIQGALANYRTDVLSSLINQQYSNLGGLSQLGQASAAGQGAAGLNTASNIGNLLTQQGAALAGGQLAQGGVASNAFGSLAKGVGAFSGVGGMPGIAKLF